MTAMTAVAAAVLAAALSSCAGASPPPPRTSAAQAPGTPAAAPAIGAAPAPVETTRAEAPAERPVATAADITAPTAVPRPLSDMETALLAHVERHAAEAEKLIEATVNINSGTMNHKGVRAVGKVFARELEALGFSTRWIPMAKVGRAGHLFAERRGSAGKRILLIGHLDTVFEADSPFQRFERVGEHMAKGPGTIDMKGGNVVILQALKALHSVGALEGTHIIVAFTGDEELTGEPLSIGRHDLIEAAKQSDVALCFEGGVRGTNSATIARRGFTDWLVEVRAKPGHSSRILADGFGAGAIYEVARILQAFRDQLGGEANLTLSPGILMAGTTADYDKAADRGTAFGKTNVIPALATVAGDLRTLTIEQRERAKAVMRAIVARNLPLTSATITFRDAAPPMAPTEGNQALFRELAQVSADLGLGPVDVVQPAERGAADISFVAPHIGAALSGLGVFGHGSHTTDETLDLRSIPVATKRAALLLYRLTRPAPAL